MIEMIIFAFCMVGSSITAFRIGRDSGAEAVVEYLVEEGFLTLEEDEQ
jgi:hypothetical protein